MFNWKPCTFDIGCMGVNWRERHTCICCYPDISIAIPMLLVMLPLIHIESMDLERLRDTLLN